MLLRIEERAVRFHKTGTPYIRKIAIHQCEVCSKIFEKVSEIRERKFCSQICSKISMRKGGSSRLLCEETTFTNFGVTCICQSDDFAEKKWTSAAAEKRKQTTLTHFGVDNPFKSQEIRKKAHETMKREGTYTKSKIEDAFYIELCSVYGSNNVDRQVHVKNWNIDFYVSSLDIFIQFDGVYWHGLDRPISEIRESTKCRDKAIYSHWLGDKHQNLWFQQNSLVLIRITDVEFKNGTYLDNLSRQY